eukprot:gi/632947757/ref/XP_007889210.1/ PREDICTED: sulfated surface glycoprotein 185-like [Callorhinchus milii]
MLYCAFASVCLEGLYCSFYELVEVSQDEALQLSPLLDRLKERNLAVVKFLKDQGLLVLFGGPVCCNTEENTENVPKTVQAVFIFKSSRIAHLSSRAQAPAAPMPVPNPQEDPHVEDANGWSCCLESTWASPLVERGSGGPAPAPARPPAPGNSPPPLPPLPPPPPWPGSACTWPGPRATPCRCPGPSGSSSPAAAPTSGPCLSTRPSATP